MSDIDVIEERGEYRVIAQIHPYPDEPENDYGNPILRLDEDNNVSATGYGSHSDTASGINAVDALDHFLTANGDTSDAVDVFARWLRIFHGGDAIGYHLGYSREYGYVAYSTHQMAIDGWGHTEESLTEHPEYLVPELTEWRAWCEGDVYLITVQREVLKRTEYVTVTDNFPIMAGEEEDWLDVEGPIGGHYGYDYAKDAAGEMLANYPGDNHEVFYISADGPSATSTWSVYREEYVSADADEPIEGTTRRMSTWISEDMAQAAAARLQAEVKA